MNKSSLDQREILEDSSRIRVVRAVPGSGKTWLIAREMQLRLDSWQDQHRGIAALSFTNTARDEISSALGYVPSHPHFVGTLDSFIFRYIVRPFAYSAVPGIGQVTLVPGEYAERLADEQRWRNRCSLNVKVGAGNHERINVFVANFFEEVNGTPIFSGRVGYAGLRRIEGRYGSRVFDRKKEIWQSVGRISHSDTAFLAREILRSELGGQVLRLIERRFPFLVVDELQDTGWYLGEVLLEILERTGCRALVVGDPDQSIFEFSGATPALFSRFVALSGAKWLEMNYSRRCPLRVRRVAKYLTGSGTRSIHGPPEEGRSIIATFASDGVEDLRGFYHRCSERDVEISVLVRKNKVAALLSGNKKPREKFGSRPVEHIYNAVQWLRRGQNRRAQALADSALSQVVFKANHVDRFMLDERGIDVDEWAYAVASILFEGHRSAGDEDRHQWALRLRDFMNRLVGEKSWQQLMKVRAPSKKLIGLPVWRGKTVSRPIKCSTVHGAKGQTHEVTAYFVSETGQSKCPSKDWWENHEERRVTYVATTRPKEALVLCMHENVLARLQASRPEFVEEFEIEKLSDLTLG